MWEGNTVRSVGYRAAKLTGQIMWLTFAFAVFGEGFGAMEIVTSAKLFKMFWLMFDFPRNLP
jgi:hypothetical protein